MGFGPDVVTIVSTDVTAGTVFPCIVTDGVHNQIAADDLLAAILRVADPTGAVISIQSNRLVLSPVDNLTFFTYWEVVVVTGNINNPSGGYQITWASDTGVKRGGAGVVCLTNGSTGSGGLSSAGKSPAQITANQNDYAPGVGMYQRWSSDASRDITGMLGGQDGEIRFIWNVGASDIVLKNQSASSTDTARFLNTTGADLTLTANKVALSQYDGTTRRWRTTLLP